MKSRVGVAPGCDSMVKVSVDGDSGGGDSGCGDSGGGDSGCGGDACVCALVCMRVCL